MLINGAIVPWLTDRLTTQNAAGACKIGASNLLPPCLFIWKPFSKVFPTDNTMVSTYRILERRTRAVLTQLAIHTPLIQPRARVAPAYTSRPSRLWNTILGKKPRYIGRSCTCNTFLWFTQVPSTTRSFALEFAGIVNSSFPTYWGVQFGIWRSVVSAGHRKAYYRVLKKLRMIPCF